jgi:hypothetical protein
MVSYCRKSHNDELLYSLANALYLHRIKLDKNKSMFLVKLRKAYEGMTFSIIDSFLLTQF